LRVRKHPDTLKITRPSILKNAKEVRWSFQDSLEMTTNFKVDSKSITDIWENIKHNIAPNCNEIKKIDGDMLYGETTGAWVIDLLRNSPNNFEDFEFLAKYIELTNSQGYLKSWRIGLKITGSVKSDLVPKYLHFDPNLGIDEIRLAKRSGPKSKNRYNNDLELFLDEGIFKASGKSANIISSNDDMALWLDDG